jgi:putative hemolysin
LPQIEAIAVERRHEARRRFVVAIARSHAEITEAQHLRYRVFVEELGARLGGRRCALESDGFDPFCEHLIVRDRCSDRVVGTYRLLTSARAQCAGAFMSEREFDLASLAAIRTGMAELGRACIDPEYRGGVALMLLWSGIGRHIRNRGFRFLFGCASIGMSDGGVNAARVCKELVQSCLSPPEYRVVPRIALPLLPSAAARPAAIPALLKGYVRLGAWVCGEPAWDPEFNTADLLVLLPIARIEQRYARHFLVDPVHA